MRFTTRSTRVEHLQACLRLLSDRHLYADRELEALVRFWSEMLTSGCARSGIALDSSEDEIVAFSFGIFLSDHDASHIHLGRRPYLGRRFFDAWMQGDRFCLRDGEIGQYNAASGVNVVTIHSGYRAFTSMEEYADLRMSLVDVFIREHIGLHIRSFAHELYGEYKEAVHASGLRIHEYDAQILAQSYGESTHSPPYLTMLCRDDAAGQRGNYLSDTMAFGFSPPRFFFNTTQRELLRVVKEDYADIRVTQKLHLSQAAVKKRWATIYESIDAVDPALLGKKDDIQFGRRGEEYRRKVIAYVRDHPEELHPYARSPVSKLDTTETH